MTGKQVIHGSSARSEFLKGVNILADAVKVTLGPQEAALGPEWTKRMFTGSD